MKIIESFCCNNSIFSRIYLSNLLARTLICIFLISYCNQVRCSLSFGHSELSLRLNPSGDTSSPTIICPPDLTINCTSNTTPVSTNIPKTIDHCANGITNISWQDSRYNGSCNDNFNLKRTWTATDSCGNSSSCQQIITVIDTTRPKIFCPENLTLDCKTEILPIRTGMTSSLDNCTNKITNTRYTDDILYNTGCSHEYYIYRTWVGWDSCGNTNNCRQIITIQDTTAPTIFCPKSVTVSCNENTGPSGTGIANATDNCTELISDIHYSDKIINSGNNGNYTIQRNWTARDSCKNQQECIQHIIMQDSLALDYIKITNSVNGSGGSIEIVIPKADSLYFIDANSLGLINKTGLNLSAGKYFVKAFVGSCIYIYGPYIVEMVNSSSETTSLEINVYSNPFKDIISAQSNDNSRIHYQLLNAQGYPIAIGEFHNQLNLAVENLCAGIYFLKCSGVNKSRMIRLIKI
jgi:hypothetical protein